MRLLRLSLALFLGFVGIFEAPLTNAIDIGTTPAFHRQRFEAWGTSLAWMGNELGGWSPTGPRQQMVDLLFEQTNQLGLNFVRYNIGAGQHPSLSIPRPGAEMDSWVPDAPASISNTATWQWDWSADSTQRWMLDQALAHGVNQVEAFANSAPWWMTISQDSTGAPNWGDSNLAQANFDEFAYYLSEVVDHFESNLGVHFNTLAPMNEPGAGWWTSPGNQEGMNVPKGLAQALLIQAVGSEIQNRGFDIGLVASEENSASSTIGSWNHAANDALTKSYVDQINTHTYDFQGDSNTPALVQLQGIAQADGKKIFASEYGTGGGSTLDGGIALANQITKDLRDLQTPGWTYWQAIENNNGSGWGLMVAPFTGTESFSMRRQYQVMRQFTSHIRPGSQVLDTSDNETVAAYDPRTDTTVIVFTNDDSNSDTNTYDLLDKSIGYTRVIRTAQSENFESLGPASVNGSQISVAGPGNSVSTIVIHHQPNLIQNANFEMGGEANGSQTISGWQIQGGAFYDYADNSHDGSESGALWADNQANSGSAFQSGIGDGATDLTGVAFELSVDVQFQNEGSSLYDANTYLALEFYGADDQTLAHQSVDDFQTLIEPTLGIDTDEANDAEFRMYRTERFVAPAGTRYVRPVIRYDSVQSGSSDWVYFDNAYLQEAHPAADGREWNIESDGNWADGKSWLSHALAENNTQFVFGNAISQASTVTLSSAEAVDELTFFSEHQYHLQGAGTLQIGGALDSALIDVRRGSHRVSVDTSAEGAVVLQVLPGAGLTFDTGLDLNGHVLTKLGAGTLDLAAGFQMNAGRIASYSTPSALITLGSDAVLDGTFELLVAPGQTFEFGDIFELVTYTALSDTFDDILLPSLSNGLVWNVDYGSNSLTAEVVNFTLEADFNGDGEVDRADLLKWEGDYGINDESDANGDGNSDGADFLVWQQQFGSSTNTQAAVSTVPEPSGSLLLAVLTTCLAMTRTR